MIRATLAACYLVACAVSPALAPASDWRQCGGDMECEELTEIACANGDLAACEPLDARHREACKATPEHDDCAPFR